MTLQEISIEWVNPQITQEWLVRRELERKLHEGMALTLEPVEEVRGRHARAYRDAQEEGDEVGELVLRSLR